MKSEKEYYRDYEKRFHDLQIAAEEGMTGYADLPRSPTFLRRKRAISFGLRDFVIWKTLDFKKGKDSVECQMAASDIRICHP